MTELRLQEALKEEIKSVIDQLCLFGENEMKFYSQDLPLETTFEDEEDKCFPCCIIKIKNGEINSLHTPQTVTAEIIICIKDISQDMSGYRDLMIIIDRIRDSLMSCAGLDGKFRIDYPIKWSINDEVASPYFIGSVITKWQTESNSFTAVKKYL